MKTITIEIDDQGNIQKIKTLSYWFDIEKYLLSQTHKEFLYNFSILADLYKENFCKLTHIDLKTISKKVLTYKGGLNDRQMTPPNKPLFLFYYSSDSLLF